MLIHNGQWTIDNELYFAVYLVTFDVNSGEGTSGTQVLASTTADALGFVDRRDVGAELIIRIKGHHLNGSRRTMARAVATFHAINDGDTILLNPYSVPYLDAGFLFVADRTNGSGGADFRTASAFRTTIASFVAHLRLHEGHQSGAGTQDTIGTLGYTELTTRAMLRQVLCRERTGRGEGCLAIRSHFILNLCQTSIGLQLRVLSKGGCGS
jgi:hypothetical protein